MHFCVDMCYVCVVLHYCETQERGNTSNRPTSLGVFGSFSFQTLNLPSVCLCLFFESAPNRECVVPSHGPCCGRVIFIIARIYIPTNHVHHTTESELLYNKQNKGRKKERKMFGVVRGAVSKEKRRYQVDGFDLGMCLCFLTFA